MAAKYIDCYEIGSGGFATVFNCRCDGDREIYAKKKLNSTSDDDAVKRFSKEVRILSSLDHPHIVKVLGMRLSNPPYYYIMPLYKRSLRAELSSVTGDTSRIDTIFSRILDALEYAHSEGVIHRDLKPENILMNEDVDLVVSDFGLGRFVDSDSTRLTMDDSLIGTYSYMAPEQMHSPTEADERSDIFSLGRMLYELYGGSIFSSVQDTSSLPPIIAMIVDRCTQNGPDKRFQKVSELRTIWQHHHDTTSLMTEEKELNSLITEFAIDSIIDKDNIKRFCELVTKLLEDKDLIHEAIMQLDPSAASETYAFNALLMRRVIAEFVKYITSQGWAFGYTDKIANKCLALYQAIDDPEIRANLIYCVSEVGIYHNRYYVMDVMRVLFYAEKEDKEWDTIGRRFLKNDGSLLRRVEGEIELRKLPPSMVAVFNIDSKK